MIKKTWVKLGVGGSGGFKPSSSRRICMRLTEFLTVQVQSPTTKQVLEEALLWGLRSITWKKQIPEHLIEILTAMHKPDRKRSERRKQTCALHLRHTDTQIWTPCWTAFQTISVVHFYCHYILFFTKLAAFLERTKIFSFFFLCINCKRWCPIYLHQH